MRTYTGTSFKSASSRPLSSGSCYGDSVYEDNGTAVRITAMPGTETLDFNNCVFRGNGTNVENTAEYAVDLSRIVTADN